MPNIDPKRGTLIPKCSRGLQPAFISPSTRWWRAKNILQRLAALGARELQRFNVLRSPCEGASNFPGARKQLRILDCDFVIDRVLVNDREAFDGMQIFAQIRYFPRIRHAAVEIGGVHDECVSFPMANGITHEQPDIFAKMFPSSSGRHGSFLSAGKIMPVGRCTRACWPRKTFPPSPNIRG